MNEFLIYGYSRRGVFFTNLGKCAFIAMYAGFRSHTALQGWNLRAISSSSFGLVVVVEIIFESCGMGVLCEPHLLFARGLWCSPTSAPTVIHSKTSVITTEYHT